MVYTQTYFRVFSVNLSKGIHNFGSNSIKAMLTNKAPNRATDQVLADITEISAGNGYTAGGVPAMVKVGGDYIERIYALDITFAASGGSIGPFRYVVIYDSTPTDPMKPLISYVDIGSFPISLEDGETLTLKFHQKNGWMMGDPHTKPFSQHS